MSALKFLSKKSWHTGLLKNNEKVWLREQADEKERARVAELQKELEDERQNEELRRLELASGRLDPEEAKKRQRIEWMYEDVETAHSRIAKERAAREQEDALLGKAPAKVGGGGGSAGKPQDAEKMRLIDAENKLREDPLLAIERERRKRGGGAGAPSTSGGGSGMTRAQHAKLAAKLARKAERREIREQRKRRREGREAATTPAAATPEPKPESRAHTSTYGLQLPRDGTDVRVRADFVPVAPAAAAADERPAKRSRTRFGPRDAPPPPAHAHKPPSQDRGERLRQMEEAAKAVYESRHASTRRRDERDERERCEEDTRRKRDARNAVVPRFAYDALRRKTAALRARQLGKNE